MNRNADMMNVFCFINKKTQVTDSKLSMKTANWLKIWWINLIFFHYLGDWSLQTDLRCAEATWGWSWRWNNGFRSGTWAPGHPPKSQICPKRKLLSLGSEHRWAVGRSFTEKKHFSFMKWQKRCNLFLIFGIDAKREINVTSTVDLILLGI